MTSLIMQELKKLCAFLVPAAFWLIALAIWSSNAIVTYKTANFPVAVIWILDSTEPYIMLTIIVLVFFQITPASWRSVSAKISATTIFFVATAIIAVSILAFAYFNYATEFSQLAGAAAIIELVLMSFSLIFIVAISALRCFTVYLIFATGQFFNTGRVNSILMTSLVFSATFAIIFLLQNLFYIDFTDIFFLRSNNIFCNIIYILVIFTCLSIIFTKSKQIETGGYNEDATEARI
ncbi:hypothetical protein [Candidatus Epulonipiscium viviparus]|uniref:hypothetical protein n=1 Tax=Candidatus Epulonipiscium viviparus TaxID=420336 RepID=UPI00016C05C4|nr:hypothetical protein [Candidatus Epulopiscium viviparus]